MTETKENININSRKSWEEALEKESWIAPLIDIYETEESFNLIAQMPGVEKENVKIKIEDGSLIMMGRIDFENTINQKYILKETETGNFYRKFNLADSVDVEKIEANLYNGELKVLMPKHDRLKPKKIEIK